MTWLSDAVTTNGHRPRLNLAEIIKGVNEGERNDALVSAAGLFRRYDIPLDEAEALILTIAANCLPPVPDEDALARLHWAYENHQPTPIVALEYSATPKNGVPAERILKWRTGSEIVRETPETPTFVARPWVVLGALTELDGKIKVGKSTLTYALCHSVLSGTDFLGEPTARSPIVFLTEQQPASFGAQIRQADLEHDDFHVLYWHDARGHAWPAIVDEAIAKCIETGAKMLVVDTLSPWAGIRASDENDAGAAEEAQRPLKYAASRDIGILINRHERKSGGDVGDSGRGSSAFSGGVDIVLALKRPEGQVKPSVRVLHALSRFAETPDTLVIEKTATGYIALGNQATVAANEAREALIAIAPVDEASAQTQAELLERLPADTKRTTFQAALSQLEADGIFQRHGKGVKGNPYRYWAADIHSAGTQNTKWPNESKPLVEYATKIPGVGVLLEEGESLAQMRANSPALGAYDAMQPKAAEVTA